MALRKLLERLLLIWIKETRRSKDHGKGGGRDGRTGEEEEWDQIYFNSLQFSIISTQLCITSLQHLHLGLWAQDLLLAANCASVFVWLQKAQNVCLNFQIKVNKVSSPYSKIQMNRLANSAKICFFSWVNTSVPVQQASCTSENNKQVLAWEAAYIYDEKSEPYWGCLFRKKENTKSVRKWEHWCRKEAGVFG